LGIASLEDKIVQQAVLWVLQSIYEQDFLGFSYGFRPGRSQHDALDAQCAMMSQKELDIGCRYRRLLGYRILMPFQKRKFWNFPAMSLRNRSNV
jgi:hypothetical protein